MSGEQNTPVEEAVEALARDVVEAADYTSRSNLCDRKSWKTCVQIALPRDEWCNYCNLRGTIDALAAKLGGRGD